MSAESSWTLLKVIWQSCPTRPLDRFRPTRSIPRSTRTHFRRAAVSNFFLPSSPFDPDSAPFPPSIRCSIRRRRLPRLSFRSNNSPSFPVSLEGRACSRPVRPCAGTRHPLPPISTTFQKRSLITRTNISLSIKISRWIHFSGISAGNLSWPRAIPWDKFLREL